jgi:hypothetical protein
MEKEFDKEKIWLYDDLAKTDQVHGKSDRRKIGSVKNTLLLPSSWTVSIPFHYYLLLVSSTHCSYDTSVI